MTEACAISSEAGGVARNSFTMGRISFDENDYGLEQTVAGPQIVAR